jgi:hypothetical protein
MENKINGHDEMEPIKMTEVPIPKEKRPIF